MVAVVKWPPPRLPPPWPVLLPLGYMAVFAVSNLLCSGTPCPRCGRAFLGLLGLKTRLPWSWRCENCGANIGDPLVP